MENKIRTNHLSIAISMLMFHSFFTAFAQYYAPHGIFRVFYAILIMLCTLGFKVPRKIKIEKEILGVLSFVMVLYVLCNNNQNIATGNINFELLFITLILFFWYSKKDGRWIDTGVKCIGVFSIIHVTCTLWLGIDKWSYLNIVFPIISNEYIGEILLQQYHNGWLPGITTHYSANAIYLSFAVGAYLIYALSLPQNIKTKNKMYFILALALIALLLTGKRGQLIASCVAMVIVVYVSMANKKRGRILKIGFGLVLIVVVFLGLSLFIPSLLNFIDRFILQMESGDITTGRSTIQKYAFEMFEGHELFGIGWDAFKYNYLNNFSIDGVMLNVHSVYIQVLVECGIIGALVFYSFFAINIYRCIDIATKTIKMKDRYANTYRIRNLLLALFIQIFFLIYSITGSPLYDEQTIIPYIFSCSIVQKYRKDDKQMLSK